MYFLKKNKKKQLNGQNEINISRKPKAKQT